MRFEPKRRPGDCDEKRPRPDKHLGVIFAEHRSERRAVGVAVEHRRRSQRRPGECHGAGGEGVGLEPDLDLVLGAVNVQRQAYAEARVKGLQRRRHERLQTQKDIDRLAAICHGEGGVELKPPGLVAEFLQLASLALDIGTRVGAAGLGQGRTQSVWRPGKAHPGRPHVEGNLHMIDIVAP